MRITLQHYLGTFLGAITTLGTLFWFYYQSFEDMDDTSLLAVGVISIFAVYFFSYTVVAKSKWAREARYSHAIPYLNKGFREIHSLSRRDGDISKEQVVSAFSKLCNHVASAFTTIIGSRCYVCIKILASSGEEPVYATLCRDDNCPSKRLRADEKAADGSVKHSLEKNTAFKEAVHTIREPVDVGFISNILPFHDHYDNSSFDLYEQKRHIGLHPLKRYRKWPLPYRSTMVVAIHPIQKGKVGSEIIGFLCIDSPKMWAFRRKYDMQIASGVAEGIYNTLWKFKELL